MSAAEEDSENIKIEQLVIRAQAGDETAMRELIEGAQDRLYRFCLYLTNNEALAQDLCQETMVKCLLKIKKLKNPKGFYSWIFQITKNQFFDLKKSPRYKGAVSLDDVDPAVLCVEKESRDEVKALQKAISELEEDFKVAVLMVDLEGYSYSEAAEIIGITESALRSRLHRARQALEITLKNEIE